MSHTAASPTEERTHPVHTMKISSSLLALLFVAIIIASSNIDTGIGIGIGLQTTKKYYVYVPASAYYMQSLIIIS
jgi:hypothetical protein